MYSPAAVIDALGGIARRDQILGAGLSGTDITAAVRRGQVRRVRRAHYATATASRDAVAAVRVGGRLGGLSAARSYGLWAGFDDDLHVVVPPNASRLRIRRRPEVTTPDIGDRAIRLHWIEATEGRECWRIPLPDALRQVVRWCDAETAMGVLDTALECGITSPDLLRAEFAGEPAASRVRAAGARTGSGSGDESIVVRRLEALGLDVRQQVVIPGVGRIDAEIEGVLLLEVDGYEFHGSPAAFDADRVRDARLLARDRPVIRLSTRRVREEWDACVADILDALRLFIPSPRFQEIVWRNAIVEPVPAATRHFSPANS